MEKIKNVLLQLFSNGNRMTGEIERERLKSEKKLSNCTLVIFRFVRLNNVRVPPQQNYHMAAIYVSL